MGRYKPLSGNLYFDTVERVIVKSLGNRFVFMRHDRRSGKPGSNQQRRLEDVDIKACIYLGNNLYFDKKEKALYKKMSSGFVLYSSDRRKQRKTVPNERRKSS
jgi:hypothetical protein